MIRSTLTTASALMATQLTQQAQVGDCLTHACWPAMKWLSNSTQETVLLAVREGDRAVIIEKLDSPRAVFSTQRLGRLLPVHTVSTGMALLASLPDAEIRELLPPHLERFTAHTPTTPERVCSTVRAARTKGYAINREQYRPGSLRGGRTSYEGERSAGGPTRRSRCAYRRLASNSTPIRMVGVGSRCGCPGIRRVPRGTAFPTHSMITAI